MEHLAMEIALLGAVGTAITFGLILFRFNINRAALMSQIIKLTRANNLDRAVKLCNVVPHAVTVRGIKAVLMLLERNMSDMDSATIRQAYEKAEEPARGSLRTVMAANALSELLILVGLAIQFLHDKDTAVFQRIETVIPLIAGALGAWGLAKGAGHLRASKAVGEQMLSLAIEHQMKQ